MKRVARAGDGWLAFKLPVEEAGSRVALLRQLTRAHDGDPDRLRIVVTVFSSTSESDLERYREAGITGFNLMVLGDLPGEKAGLEARLAELSHRFVDKVAAW